MALIIKKSMEIQNFAEDWEIIKALVASEYEAVEGLQGYYEINLELIWDCEEDNG